MIKSALICALIALLPLIPGINEQRPDITEARNALVENLLEAFLEKTKLPGLSMAVSKNGEIVYAKAFGYADREAQRLMQPDTRIRTASVAKVITATALGKLISEGKLDIDLPIKTYISYINPRYENLTTRQLAGHTSGMEHRPGGIGYKKKLYTSTRETVELMRAPLLFEPDTKYKYSTHAFNLLAAVIEGASGMSYQAYMQEEIFTPLGMNSTMPEHIKTLTEKDAQIYYFKKGKLRKDKLSSASYKLAGAGFRSTPTDLLKMMEAYTSGFISPKVVAQMFSSNSLKSGEKTQVGVGWRNSFDAFGNPVIEHAGSWRGARTVVVHYPEENLSISLMINAECQVFIEETAHMIAQLFREGAEPSPNAAAISETLTVTIRNNGKENTYTGKWVMDEQVGLLQVDHDGFLQKAPVFFLGRDKQYAVLTQYGLMYMEVEKMPTLRGEVYLYFNRNKSNPTEQSSMVTLSAVK